MAYVENYQKPVKFKEAPYTAEQSPPFESSGGDEAIERVMKVAFDTFGDVGFEAASTREIAERAGVSYMFFIYHFKSKENLWLRTMDDAITNMTKVFWDNLNASEDKPAEVSLRIYIDQFVRLSARYPQMHRIMSMERNQNTPRLQFVIRTHLRAIYSVVCDLLRRGQQEGAVKPGDAERLFYLIIGTGGTLFTIPTEYEIFTGRDVFSEEEISEIIDFIADAVFLARA